MRLDPEAGKLHTVADWQDPLVRVPVDLRGQRSADLRLDPDRDRIRVDRDGLETGESDRVREQLAEGLEGLGPVGVADRRAEAAILEALGERTEARRRRARVL